MTISPHEVVDRLASSDRFQRRACDPRPWDWVFVLSTCALLFFAVLAFGAVDEWSIFIFEAGAGSLFLIWVAKQVIAKELRLSNNPLYPPALMFLGLILVQIGLHTSAYEYATKIAVLRYISYGVVLLITAECIREEAPRKRFALMMVIFGTLFSFFALSQQLTSNGKIFWIHSPRSHGSIYGSYVNHNHYAGLMEMLVPIPLVLSMGRIFKGGQRALIVSSTVLMASTIFLSGSRGGMVAFLLEVVLFSLLTLAQRKDLRVAIGSAAVCGLVLVFLGFIGKGQVLGRLGDLGPGIRLDIVRDCSRMFAHRPILGWGLGTFPTVYPRYRSFYTNLFVNEAHNDYAQLLVETGLLGFGLMLWFLSCVYRNGWPRSRSWEFRWSRAVSLAALLGCTGFLFHSFVDFNLQIPANAALFYLFCGLAASELTTKSGTGPTRAVETAGIEKSSGLHD